MKFYSKKCCWCRFRYPKQEDVCPNCFREYRKLDRPLLKDKKHSDSQDWVLLYDETKGNENLE